METTDENAVAPADEKAGDLTNWKPVPIEPTGRMTFVGQSMRYDPVNSIGAIYRAMIEAAPDSPTATGAGEVSARQLEITLGKVWAGYRPGDELWSELDTQALDHAEWHANKSPAADVGNLPPADDDKRTGCEKRRAHADQA